MGLKDRFIAGLARAVANIPLEEAPASSPVGQASPELVHLREMVTYLEHEVSRLAAIQRHLAGPVIRDLPYVRQTRESFDFQWDKLPSGRFMLESPEFRKEAPGYVCQFTGLPAEWFKGKSAADVGCGLGRYSWALCTLGAKVLSMDQSAHGLARASQACAGFEGHRTMPIDLLEPLKVNEQFDLVWCYGVLHHTGDTYRAFCHVAPLVRPGGYLFLMIYGEPRPGRTEEYQAVNEYEFWRQRTRNMDLQGKLEAIRKGMAAGEFQVRGEEHVHGYFDAIAPTINDLHSWEEIEGWLLREGFTDIRRTVDHRNHHVIARKPPAAGQ
jgi:2-polyprenyl-3-methyl-5-hydroxy-6-metoxy-1,4-benzoquinol methylase